MNKYYLRSIRNVSLVKPSKAIRLLLMVLFVSTTYIFSFGQSQTFSTPGTYTFTVPAGVTTLNVQAWGSGGGADNTKNKAGGGGAFAGSNSLTVISGGIYTIKVGAGAGAATGNDGVDSSFGSLVIAKGGNGGSNFGKGGLASASTGAIKFNGGDGGSSTGNGGAGGGGAGGTLAVGLVGANTGNNSGGTGGAGGNIGGGAGGNGGDISNNGTNGSFPGGGGGEKGKNGGSSGGGGNGQVIVSWVPNPTITSFTPSNACAASGASVVITGTNFTGSTAVKFNGVNASFIVNSDTQITAQLPALATSGALTVTTPGGTATSATSFTVIATPLAPIVGTTTQPNCTTATGSVVLNGLPAGNWMLTRSPGSIATTGTGTSTTISGLSTGTYTYSVNGLNNGLKGEYYNNKYFTGSPVLTRTDATVGFNWAAGSPDPSINVDNFSVRWTGFIQPLNSETYTFTTRSDDGIRLWVNGTQLINNWNDHSAVNDSGSILLTAGVKYDIVLEYYENGGDALSQLSWSSTTNPTSVIIPQTQLYSVANCGSLASANVVLNAQPSTPSAPTVGTTTQPNCTTPTGSVILSGLPTGSWALTRNPGNVATLGTGTSTTVAGLVAGTTYNYTVDTANNGTGLKGEYYNNIFAGPPILTRTDATVNFNWGTSSPGGSLGIDNFSVKWSGFVQPLLSEIYTFSTRSDDGIRLWVNGVQIINNWTDHGDTTDTGTIALTAGVKYSIILEYYENGGDALSQLSWSSPTNPTSVIIPTTQLFPASSCSSHASANVVINAQPATPIVPTVGTITQPCGTDARVVLSGLPASGSINQTGTVNTSYVITGTTMTITGLAAGTYNFTASNGSCSSSATGNVVINAAVTNTWNTFWSNGTPNSSQNLVFSGNYPPAVDPNVDLTACSCMVTGAATVTIKSGRTLTVTNEVTVIGGGTLTFENNASLVQTNNAAINSGNITYKRTTSSARTSDYTYWSSPVVNQTLNISSSYAAGMFYSYDDFATPEGWKKETAATTMQIGKGYIIRGPQITSPPPPPPGLVDAIFVGVPNNGEKTIAIGPTGTSNLLGNPYPSAIDADAFLAANSTFVEGTIYFWTHNTAIQLASTITNGTAGSGALAYTSDDYASYNTTGGVGTGNFVNGVEILSNKPTGKIAAGQAFFTTSLGAGTVVFNNNMRVFGNNTQFFKTKNPKTKIANSIEKNRIWLNLTNAKGAFKQTLIGYVTDATNDYDSRFDGASFDANEFIDFYSINQDKNLVIQGRALPFDENDEVPLGFRSTIEGAFTININQVDGLLANQPVFIEDKLTNTVFDLKRGDYTFSTVAGTFDDRFVLKYNSKTLGIDVTNKQDGISVIYSNNNETLIIHNNGMDSTVYKVTLYNMIGQDISNWDVDDSEQTNIQIPIKNISSGIYIVKVKTTKGESSKKIVIK